MVLGMATRRDDTWYEARMLTGSGRLADTWDTLSEARKGIDKSNQRALRNGYTPSSYLITKTDLTVEFTDSNEFKGRWVVETAVETYPAER